MASSTRSGQSDSERFGAMPAPNLDSQPRDILRSIFSDPTGPIAASLASTNRDSRSFINAERAKLLRNQKQQWSLAYPEMSDDFNANENALHALGVRSFKFTPSEEEAWVAAYATLSEPPPDVFEQSRYQNALDLLPYHRQHFRKGFTIRQMKGAVKRWFMTYRGRLIEEAKGEHRDEPSPIPSSRSSESTIFNGYEDRESVLYCRFLLQQIYKTELDGDVPFAPFLSSVALIAAGFETFLRVFAVEPRTVKSVQELSRVAIRNYNRGEITMNPINRYLPEYDIYSDPSYNRELQGSPRGLVTIQLLLGTLGTLDGLYFRGDLSLLFYTPALIRTGIVMGMRSEPHHFLTSWYGTAASLTEGGTYPLTAGRSALKASALTSLQMIGEALTEETIRNAPDPIRREITNTLARMRERAGGLLPEQMIEVVGVRVRVLLDIKGRFPQIVDLLPSLNEIESLHSEYRGYIVARSR